MLFLRRFDRRCFLPMATFALLFCAEANAGDPIRGRELAKIWCMSCHLPHEAGSAKVMAIPALEEVVRKTNESEKTLAQLLMMPHPAMPDRGLGRDEAEDIAAYLSSLRK